MVMGGVPSCWIDLGVGVMIVGYCVIVEGNKNIPNFRGARIIILLR